MAANVFVGLVAVGALLFLGAVLYRWLRFGAPAFLRMRGERVITCPENGQPAGVRVDAAHAATAAAHGQPELRLADCSRWPEKAGCGQECVRQIEAAPGDCLVVNMLTRWYTGKQCYFCKKSFDAVHWHDHKPALLGPDGRVWEWSQVPADKIPEALAVDRPVCWTCQVKETFRQEHPELVTDRPWSGPERHERLP